MDVTTPFPYERKLRRVACKRLPLFGLLAARAEFFGMLPLPMISEARFRCKASGKLQIVSASGDIELLFGYPEEKFCSGKSSLLDHIHSGDADIAKMLAGRGGPESGAVCLRLRRADGRIGCFEAQFSKQGNGRKAEVDLTLRPAGAVWRSPIGDNPPQFRAMLEGTEESVFFKDRNHVFIAASPAFRPEVAQTLGERGLLGLTDYDFLPESDADTYYALEKRALLSGAPAEELIEVTRPGQGTSWMHIQHRPVTSSAGEVVGLFTTARDLTKRVHGDEPADEALINAELGTYVLDLRRGAAATSASLDAILGLDEDYPRSLCGWENLLHPEDRASTVGHLAAVLETPGRIFTREYRILRHSDGAVRWIHAIGRIDRDAEGRPLLMRGTLEDITGRKQTEAALRETTQRLELFIEHVPAGLAVYDREMRVLAVSNRWRDVYGIKGDVIGRCIYDVIADVPERWKEVHRRALGGETIRCEEDCLDRPDGSVLWTRWEVIPWRHADDSIGGVMVFVENINERKRAEERVKLATSVFEHASEAIIVTTLNGSILEVNDGFTVMTGYGRREVLGRHIGLLRSEAQGEEYYEEIEQTVRDKGRWRGEMWNRGKDGTYFATATTITTVYDSAGKPQYYVTLLFDVTPIKVQEQRLEHVARHDALTGLPNRAQLTERLRTAMNSALETGRMLAVVYLDLDNFKAVNDVHGEQAADNLLVSVASRMKQVLREADTLGRLGGDEFVAILPDLAEPDAASPVIERLLRAAAEPYPLGECVVQMSGTAGATFYPQQEEIDADQLLRQADQAMYEAKLAGKSRFHIFDPMRDHSVRGRHEEVKRIRQALDAKEFVLHYQPKVNMATGALIGVEALIRWEHPERGLLPPGLFLPQIEEHELAIDVGEWVIGTALKQIEEWASQGHRIPVSVNVSARHLQQQNFIERLRALLEAHPKVDPTCLELEILETSMLEDVAHVSRIINACMELGISVALDDFGTGYSSLTYLKRLPATVLKIDQSFVRDMLEDADDLAILQGIMGLASAFRRTPVAEGVETIEHGAQLLKLGCTYAQGWGIAKPMPAANLLAWYAQWQPDQAWTSASPVSPFDWPILIAEVELGAWTRALEQYLNGVQPVAPELEEKRCRFGVWLEGEKSGPRAASPVIPMLEFLHAESHRVASEAVEAHRQGRVEQARELLSEAVSLGNQLHFQLCLLYISPQLKPQDAGMGFAAAGSESAATVS